MGYYFCQPRDLAEAVRFMIEKSKESIIIYKSLLVYHSIMRIQQYHIGYILFALSVIALWLGISIGSAITDISLPIKALTAIFSEQDNYLLQIVTQIRIPRVIMAFIIGATLAISGASLQGICRNPLADPGLIGVSSGAAVGAVLAIVFANQIPYFDTIGSYLVPVAAFMGATITVFCVYWLAQSTYGMQIATFLLAGIAVNALAGAIIAMVNYIADDQSLRLIIF
ncbi:uncharacterized ABC transporter permease protein YvrB-like [Lepeophtheirus salmonis]|uniref:uncharacterized ABC transporter permease protein YvrB-like n=1 Tax=Lepeophtheirus salmonis TaxID=72036 RepID=UPI001AE7E5C3|nr:hemin transport system permease protein HmuU-like [Lepeophtheirus salmonis]